MRNKKLTVVSLQHYWRLCYRSVLLIIGIIIYIYRKTHHNINVLKVYPISKWFLILIWVIYAMEMLLRFFPSKLESPGCQKQFAQNYIKTGNTQIIISDNNATILVALLWITLNGFIGAFKLMGIFDDGIMLLVCLIYSVCDMICILFFCPFQTWFLKNKCCAACRIYNWDYAMMFTPLFFVKAWYSWSLLLMSVGLLIRWEITIFNHPERFGENTNGYLKCSNCTEKLCSHKKQLHTLWIHIGKFTKRRIDMLKK